MYCSAFALASKGMTAVYLPPEMSATGGRVLKMMYLAIVSTARLASVLTLVYSISKASGPANGSSWR